ncbi:uncharacterized protein PHALS_12564 [Plasmopara halstedii]|uniref:Uncharacterized protein n=1 Tax=Plasmopara halstedii TaxID=4781 RepID=A0A0P1ALJ1_PLAHL|nr:uncharacterized protein PHALS_12564 [Plasmopara halstedii]CEG42276.1 hypothetical protein PHALS_12564 [Plasmopara halstedii]|eukprot:XP_024578645.1 hypothetical protein PHALS_12564 [Plasmopara halstedii]
MPRLLEDPVLPCRATLQEPAAKELSSTGTGGFITLQLLSAEVKWILDFNILKLEVPIWRDCSHR